MKIVKCSTSLGKWTTTIDVPVITSIHDQLSAIDPKYLNEAEILKSVNDGIRLYMMCRVRHLHIHPNAKRSNEIPWWER